LGQIKWEQMVFLGNPEYGVDLHPIDFAAFAHACGGVGFSVDDPADCGRALEEFLAAPGPAILQASVDPLNLPCAQRSRPSRRCTLLSLWPAGNRTVRRLR